RGLQPAPDPAGAGGYRTRPVRRELDPPLRVHPPRRGRPDGPAERAVPGAYRCGPPAAAPGPGGPPEGVAPRRDRTLLRRAPPHRAEVRAGGGPRGGVRWPAPQRGERPQRRRERLRATAFLQAVRDVRP